ncbi:hypothetical protein EX30DRAFT_339166 [Ascodesmis nigricans]|uniref:TPR-like protein n=1 Tax=Ascodesmis nigricans TaxID=341454 RepID=A0A4S2N1I4_9PEZI|nr:hypothetical protein EX30DRAFT_339166 [Ascodesmis nigricans]
MAKTRPRQSSSSKKKKTSVLNSAGSQLSTNPLASPSSIPPLSDLLTAAQSHLDSASPNDALPLVQAAITAYPSSSAAHALFATTLLDLTPPNPELAFQHYTQASTLSPRNPQYLLWAAQLHPDGGEGAVPVIETAMTLLRETISGGQNTATCATPVGGEDAMSADEARALLTSALCSCAEIYMSDLCMSPDAEQRCERYVGEAVLVSPESCEALQTLASVRISQERMEEATAALRRAREVVGREIAAVEAAEEAEESGVAMTGGTPTLTPFPIRVGLARLLVEVGVLDDALETLEELLGENDALVDLWYLGGWTWYLMGEKILAQDGAPQNEREEGRKDAWKEAAKWLTACLKLYETLEWEDEGIRDHAVEVLSKVKEVVGEIKDDDEEGDGEEGWESEDEDEEMT